jgi:hypothetical protein
MTRWDLFVCLVGDLCINFVTGLWMACRFLVGKAR